MAATIIKVILEGLVLVEAIIMLLQSLKGVTSLEKEK